MQHVSKNIHQKQPKFQPQQNSSMLENHRHVTVFLNYCIEFCQPTFHTHSCLRVSFSKAAIIILKKDKIVYATNLKSVTITFFFC